MSAIKVTKQNFQSEVIESGKPVLVDFFATWCGPCKILGPILDEIAEEREDIKVCKINVDEEGELAQRFRVVSIPTLLVFENGEVKKQSVGALPKETILEWF
jgi:thioredoxin 1